MCFISQYRNALCMLPVENFLSFAGCLQKWLSNSGARNRLMAASLFIRPSSMLKCVLSLNLRVLLFMLLVVAGDVERNPGPLSKEGTRCV